MKQRSQRDSVGQEGQARRDLNTAQTLLHQQGNQPQGCKRFQESGICGGSQGALGFPLPAHRSSSQDCTLLGCWAGSDVGTTTAPLPHSCFLQAAASCWASSQCSLLWSGTTAPETQRNLLGMDSVGMKLLQLTGAASEIVHHCGPVIPLQMATAAAALGGEFRMLFPAHPEPV